jgi:hypothetical protein
MSNDVAQENISTFVMGYKTVADFIMFSDLVQEVFPDDSNIKVRTDMLISGMIGIALCMNRIPDYPWADAAAITDRDCSHAISCRSTSF